MPQKTSNGLSDQRDRRVPFRTRARTVDHLGRGQIADAPTAVSELWKNAYDAYARHAYLYLFEKSGESPPTGVVLDDGHGMSADDFLSRWLVIGTEAKVTGPIAPPSERFGLPERVRQGEKGIGRLSAAFLAPVTLLVSKRRGGPYVAALIDWRLFENPLLDLADVFVAVEEFDELDSLYEVLPSMGETVRENVTGTSGTKERRARLEQAWTTFDKVETEAGAERTTSAAITGSEYDSWVRPEHLGNWPVWLHDDPHGTALLLFDLEDLNVLVDMSSDPVDASRIEQQLIGTLTNYTDPFQEEDVQFEYEVTVSRADGTERRLMASGNAIGPGDFEEFEHWVDGEFDERGRFKGRLRAFGGEAESVSFIPARLIPTTGSGRPGPFSISVCTTEQDAVRSSHVPEVLARHRDMIKRFGGMNVFRDGLRVQPYGREDADLFAIEDRRSRHAGREFWSYRRLFGRVVITRDDNPQLRDKAGREGLVDNAARRAFKRLVIGLLREMALRYFGTDSEDRVRLISEIQARRRLGEESATEARRVRRREFRAFLRSKESTLSEAVEEARDVRDRLVRTADLLRRGDAAEAADALGEIADRLGRLLDGEDLLRPPLPPQGLSEEEEVTYRSYRDTYGSLTEELDSVREAFNEAEAEAAESPDELVRARARSLAARVAGRLDRYDEILREAVGSLSAEWSAEISADKLLFAQRIADVTRTVVQKDRLLPTLRALDERYDTLSGEVSAKYDSRVDSVERLRGGVELSAALASADDQRADLERRLADIEAVAQLGITVEIIGHELEALDHDVERSLRKLRADGADGPVLDRAFEAHRALTDRIRFLSPLQLSGYRRRREISGNEIAEYVEDFFKRRFKREKIAFEATPSFRSMSFNDLPSRIYPVFQNLVNNATYWAGRASSPAITFDFVDGKAVVADNGPGVDPDDRDRLFQLFFSRRPDGRGVGLYLARVNLAAANHQIRYAREDDPHILPGANFIIEFRGVRAD